MGYYFHSIVVDNKKCSGCLKCMRVCPTEAIRVRQKVSAIMEERCIDCGKCIAVCPYSARNGLTDTFSIIEDSKFKYTLCLPSPVIYSQFGKDTTPNEILNAFLRIGFDDVVDVSYTCELYNWLIQEYISRMPDNEITISSMCPAVVRLIHFKFPHLAAQLFPMESSRGISAIQAKTAKAKELGLSSQEIQAVYITPCPAKMISINQPQCKEDSYLDGALSIAYIYSSVLKVLGERDKEQKQLHKSGGIGISWGMIGGEIRGLNPETSIAVDGITNVMAVLGDIEDEKIRGIKYIELRACTGGCIGGSFTVENQYLARNKIVRLIRKHGKERRASMEEARQVLQNENFYCDISLRRHSIDSLDNEPKIALKKLNERDNIYKMLPDIDCGICGAPTCKSFAEDVVQGRATIGDCNIKYAN